MVTYICLDGDQTGQLKEDIRGQCLEFVQHSDSFLLYRAGGSYSTTNRYPFHVSTYSSFLATWRYTLSVLTYTPKIPGFSSANVSDASSSTDGNLHRVSSRTVAQSFAEGIRYLRPDLEAFTQRLET